MSSSRKVFLAAKFLLLVGLFNGLFLILGNLKTQAANPTSINFQGKVVNADGTNVTNGSYTFVFRLYDSSSPTTTGTCASNSSCWWEETDSITVTNGVFQVELGSGCAFTSACNSSHSGINFNTNNAMYLTMKFNSDAAGFMSPTIHLTTAPYAFNADNLGGLSASAFAQLSSSNTFTSANTFTPTGANGLTFNGDDDSSLSIAATVTGNASSNSLSITWTDNGSGTNTAAAFKVINAANGANAGVPAALAYLLNSNNTADTIPDGLLVEQNGSGSTLTSGIEIKQTAGTLSTGLQFTGTFGNVLKVGSTVVVDASGNISTARLSGNYVASITSSGGISGNCSSTGCAASLSIDQTASLTWTGTETFNGAFAATPNSTNNFVINTDNDSNLQVLGSFSGTGPTEKVMDLQLTDNATAVGTSYILSVTNNDNGANAGVPSALAYLLNNNTAETVTRGLLVEQNGTGGTLTRGIEIKQSSSGTVTSGLVFTGSFSSYYISAPNFTVNGLGAVTAGSNILTGSGSDLRLVSTFGFGAIWQDSSGNIKFYDNSGSNVAANLAIYNGASYDDVLTTANAKTVTGKTFTGLTVTGAAASINASSNFDTNINTGNSTGTVTIGNSLSTALKLGKFGTTNGVIYVSATDGTLSETAASTGAQCLQTSGSGTAPIWGACGAGGSGYATIQDEGSGLTVRTTLNFTGSGVTCADNSGSSRTDCTINPADSLDFSELKDSLTLDANTSIGFGGASNFGLTFTDDGSSNLTINLSSTGDFVVQDNGTAAFTINDTGSSTFKTTVAASNGFQIQDSAGAALENWNTLTTPNVIANPNFEVNLDGWLAKGTGSIAITDAAGTFNFGTRAMQVNTTNTANEGAKYVIALQPSQTYTISWYDKLSSGTFTDVIAGYAVDGATDSNCTSINTQTVSTSSWTQHTCTITTTSTAPSGSSYIYIKQTAAPGATRTFYVDGVTLVNSGTALAFTNPANYLDITEASNGLAINSSNSGQLMAWQLNPNSLAANRDQAAAAVSNGFLYVVGGWDGAAAANTVYFAKMNGDGSLGSFSSSGNTLPAGVRYPAAAVANGYLYVVGGATTAGASVSTIYYSKLNADGTVGTWQTNNVPLPVARYGESVVISNGIIYILGGCTGTDATVNCATPSNINYYGKLNADGSVQGVTASSTMTSSGQNLPAARGMGSATFVNGFIYYMGGYNASIQNTVYYASVNAGGDLNAWSTSGGTTTPNLSTAKREHNTVVANGYVYIVAGCTAVTSGVCSTASNTVQFAKLNNDGTWGSWQTNTNNLPVSRSSPAGIIANGYVYSIGGFDGSSTRFPTVYYASTSRVLLGGSLDLVGISGGALTDYGGGGALTAGNTRVMGDLKVDGFADFNNGISVDSVINLNAVSGSLGQKIFNINNSSANSIFNIQHMGSNFGAAATSGAFISKNNYWGEEFNDIQPTACSATATANGWNVRGDIGSHAGACTANAGELALSRVIANVNATLPTSAACSSNITCGGSAPSGAYGIERISAAGNTGTSQTVETLEYIATTSGGGTASGFAAANNLPIFTAKVKPSLTASSNNARFFIGLGDKGAASGLFPSNGVFFSNCTATGTPACSGTNWIGVVTTTAGGVVGTVTCNTTNAPGLDNSGNINTSNYNYLRFEVRSNTDIHFFVDTDTSNGINERECGAVTGTGPAATGLSPMMEAAFMTNTATTENLDIDYVRIWQDDPPSSDANTVSPPTDSPTDDHTSDPPLTPDDPSAEATNSIIDFTAASSEDTVFNKNVYVKGTLYADKVVANQIEGLEVLTDKISSLQDQLAKGNPPTGGENTPPPGLEDTSNVNFGNVGVVNLVSLAQIESKGGLTVDKDAQFNGKTLFQLLAEFNGPVSFHNNVSFDNQPTFNNDNGGYALIKKNTQKVSIKFTKEYTREPLIVANWVFDDTKDDTGKIIDGSDAKQQRILDGGYAFSVANVTTKSFDIILNKKASEDFKLTWLAQSINNATISQSDNP